MIENQKYIEKIIKECGIAFLSTLSLDNVPETRALANWCNQGHIDINALYFTTNTESPKVEQIKKNNKTSLYYFVPENMQNLTLFGIIEIVNDKKIKDSLWKEEFKNYYPKGKDDEMYTIIKFTPKSFKYYNDAYKKLEGKF